MARALWNGAISFGLVTIPIDLYSAVESREELSFHLLHKKDGARIDYKRFCEEEGIEVPYKDIVKGYEYEKGRYVVMTDADFEKARSPATQTFDIRAFVDAREIDYLYFDHPYYLAPSGKAGAKAYALLRAALADTGKVGIGTIVLRQREHLGALEPSGDALVLTTMRFAHEIRSPEVLELPKAGQRPSPKEMALAHQLIDTLAATWDPTAYKDTYTDVLRAAIQQKIEGKPIRTPAPASRPKVVNLVKALQASLKEGGARKDLARAARAKPISKRRQSRQAA